jgi:L-ascorbate metabolism protein UlaG (beta-lactamase superfamily)
VPGPAELAPGRITYVGHSTVLLELSGTRLLTDPVLGPRLLFHINRVAEPPSGDVADEIDAVLISHLHHDHLDFRSLRRVGRAVRVIAPARSAGTLCRRGFRNVTELAVGGSSRVGDVEVIATPLAHDGRRYKLGPTVDALGFDLRAAGRRVFFAGDTGLFEGFRELAGELDVALLPIWGWGPRLRLAHHLDPRAAAEAVAMLRPRIAVPIHWGTLLRAGQDRNRARLLEDPPREFVAHAAELAPGVEVRVLAPGESLEL